MKYLTTLEGRGLYRIQRAVRAGSILTPHRSSIRRQVTGSQFSDLIRPTNIDMYERDDKPTIRVQHLPTLQQFAQPSGTLRNTAGTVAAVVPWAPLHRGRDNSNNNKSNNDSTCVRQGYQACKQCKQPCSQPVLHATRALTPPTYHAASVNTLRRHTPCDMMLMFERPLSPPAYGDSFPRLRPTYSTVLQQKPCSACQGQNHKPWVRKDVAWTMPSLAVRSTMKPQAVDSK